MPETTTFHKTGISKVDDGYQTWLSKDVKDDLIKQGGLEESVLQISLPNTSNNSSYLAVYNGSYMGKRFSMRWIHNEFLSVFLEEPVPELVEAFSKVVGYEPFARYVCADGMYAVEWDKVNPDKRYEKLQGEERKGLERIGIPAEKKASAEGKREKRNDSENVFVSDAMTKSE